MSEVRVFRSMLSALTYVLGEEADKHFTLYESPQSTVNCLDDLLIRALTTDTMEAEILETTTVLSAGGGEACAQAVGSEAHYGYVVSHYTKDGEIVRFLGIK